MTDHNKRNGDLEFEMVFDHAEDKDSVTFNDSCELIDTAIEEATNNKKILASTMDLVISLMKQVECQEKAAAQAKEEVATSGLDILAEVEQLKQKHQLAKETIDKHARRVYARKAVLARNMTEVQTRASSVLNEGCTSIGVLNKMRTDLEKRMTTALEEKKLADIEKVEKQVLARKALAHEESQRRKLVEELQWLKEEAANNFRLQQFLVDRGHVIDMLDGDISEKCQDVNLLKESLKHAVSSCSQTSSNGDISEKCQDVNFLKESLKHAVSSCSQTSSMLVSSTTSSLTNEMNEPADEHVQAVTKNPVQSLNSATSAVSPKHELLTKKSNMDLEALEIDKNLKLGSDLENSHVVSDITQVGRAKSTEGFVTLREAHNQEVALPSAIKSCNDKKSLNGKGKQGKKGKKVISDKYKRCQVWDDQ